MSSLRELAERLETWAQDEEMIDFHFTEHGSDCNRAALIIRALSQFTSKIETV